MKIPILKPGIAEFVSQTPPKQRPGILKHYLELVRQGGGQFGELREIDNHPLVEEFHKVQETLSTLADTTSLPISIKDELSTYLHNVVENLEAKISEEISLSISNEITPLPTQGIELSGQVAITLDAAKKKIEETDESITADDIDALGSTSQSYSIDTLAQLKVLERIESQSSLLKFVKNDSRKGVLAMVKSIIDDNQ
jgi:hypothetical protein